MAEQIKTEQWKTIKNFPDYAVSTYGRVKRITVGQATRIGHILKPGIGGSGYLHVSLAPRGKKHKPKTIHRIVLETFISPCPEGKECNHRDGNKTNNCLKNLEWISRQENIYHSVKILGCGCGERNGSAKLADIEVLQIRQLYKTGNCSQRQLAKQFGISQSAIGCIVRREHWKHI